MPRFEPFAALRYAPKFDPSDVTCPPYDVLSAADRAALAARDSHNAVLIDLPDEADGPGRYDEAGARLRGWIAAGVLEQDAVPTFTVYRMSYTDDRGRPAHTLGVIGALELSEPGEGPILPHEHTTPKAKSDRLDLLRGSRANLSAIWGLSLSSGLSDLLVSDAAPLQSWTDAEGVVHEVWRLDDPRQVAAIVAAVGQTPVVIADGHHRYETSLAYRNERRAEGHAGPADATMALIVELADDELTVRPIHRLIAGLPDGFDLSGALAERGLKPGERVTPAEVANGSVLSRMADEGAMALVDATGGAVLLSVDPAAFGDQPDLDSARLAQALAALPAHEVHYQHGTDLVQDAVTTGSARYGVLLRPATVAQIRANANAGERMPPKTTFFHPKPKTGIVFRLLD